LSEKIIGYYESLLKKIGVQKCLTLRKYFD